jgi:YEATS domain-containing protein 4
MTFAAESSASSDKVLAEAPSGKRMQRSIVFGSIAVPIKKPESDHTHKWTVYVRGFHDEDVSTWIKRVVFRLHESFPTPSRAIEQSPFEVTETGWGEFQLNIRIVFQDPNQKPLNFTHHLKLYPTEEANQVKTSRPIVSEHYEEIIFDPPTELMASVLQKELQYLDLRTSHRYAECIT